MNEEGKALGLYGSYIDLNKAVGYCKRHGTVLTVRTLKCHECLKKQCNALEKYETHDYWRQRAQKKELKKMKKMKESL
jgi:hypothetical protein